MRRLAALGLVIAAAAAVGPAFSAQPPIARFGNLRICSYEAYSAAQGRCTKDMRTTPLVSNKFSCSVTAHLARPARITGRMTFDGLTQFTTSTRLLDRGIWTWSIFISLPTNLPLPGGTWGCRFSVGPRHIGLAYRSGGPTGPAVDLAVCDSDHAVQKGAFPTCRADESAKPLPAGAPILCNGAFVGKPGSTVEVDLVSNGTVVATGTQSVTRAPAWFVFQTFPIEPPGSYSCRFVSNGATQAEWPFTTAG